MRSLDISMGSSSSLRSRVLFIGDVGGLYRDASFMSGIEVNPSMNVGPRVRWALREGGSFAARALPRARSVAIERYLRGWEEHHLLSSADLAVVSFGKSGRTWLRVLLSRFYQQHYGLPADRLLENDSLHRLNAAVPRVLFTHDNYLSDYMGEADPRARYAGHRVLLLVRHPADTAVSQFFQWKHRMNPR